jgi:hypothetical protein
MGPQLCLLTQGVSFPFPGRPTGSRVGGRGSLYLSDLKIARATGRSHNQQGTQKISPKTLRVQLPHHPPQPGFRKASNHWDLGREMRWEKKNESNPAPLSSHPSRGIVAPKVPRFRLAMRGLQHWRLLG